MARTSYANRAQMGHILAAMMPTNALIVRICMRTGLRVSDVLELKTAQLNQDRPFESARREKLGAWSGRSSCMTRCLHRLGATGFLRAG